MDDVLQNNSYLNEYPQIKNSNNNLCNNHTQKNTIYNDYLHEKSNQDMENNIVEQCISTKLSDSLIFQHINIKDLHKSFQIFSTKHKILNSTSKTTPNLFDELIKTSKCFK